MTWMRTHKLDVLLMFLVLKFHVLTLSPCVLGKIYVA